ncbi:hypothetical protein [Paenibacillus turpanensis]|uniref:hypothetical protein n=1 Tax=Paenibacillus turpanensis TaxID=2689078 RepID=UPI00140B0D7B|nr:hypothetical protein [Paenibacillus turpanensis]
MSEFSSSFHLRTERPQDAIDLLQNAGSTGFVFPETNGWVTFLADGPAFHMEDSIISYNPGILIHYTYMEDHGWSLQIYSKDDLVFDYKCDWTDELVIEKGEFDLDLLRELIIRQGNSAEGLEAIFELDESSYHFEAPPAYVIAQKLGLGYYEWLSSDNIGNGEHYDNIVAVK